MSSSVVDQSRHSRTIALSFYVFFIPNLTCRGQKGARNLRKNIPEIVFQLIHYFAGKQTLKISLPWPACKSKQTHVDSHTVNHWHFWGSRGNSNSPTFSSYMLLAMWSEYPDI